MDASMLELERAQNFQARTALGLWVIVPGRGRAFEKSLSGLGFTCLLHNS